MTALRESFGGLLHGRRVSNAAAAATTYREVIAKLADAEKLRAPEIKTLEQAMRDLGIEPEAVDADVAAVRAHRKAVASAGDISERSRAAVAAGGEAAAEIRRLKESLRQAEARRAMAEHTLKMLPIYAAAVRRLEGENPRLFGNPLAPPVRERDPTGVPPPLTAAPPVELGAPGWGPR